MILLNAYNGTYQIVNSSNASDAYIAFAIIGLITFTLICVLLTGIWRIHQSIDKQTAVIIRQTEAIEALLTEENRRQ